MLFTLPNFQTAMKNYCLIYLHLIGCVIFPLVSHSQPCCTLPSYRRAGEFYHDSVRLDSLITTSKQQIITNDSLHNQQTYEQIQSLSRQLEYSQWWSYLSLSAIFGVLIAYLIVKLRRNKALRLGKYPTIARNHEYTDLKQAEAEIEKYTPAQLSLLWLSNEPVLPGHDGDCITLTTKEIYIWGILFASLMDRYPEMETTQVISAFRNAVRSSRNRINRYYEGIQNDDSYNRADEQWSLFQRMATDMSAQLGIQIDTLNLEREQYEVMNNLIKRRLIKDPILTTIFGVSVLVAGFIPYGFTQKTKAGQVLSRKANALFWSYEVKNSRGVNTIDIKFRLWKIITAFKKALAEVDKDEETP
jgi:hypothetical protein